MAPAGGAFRGGAFLAAGVIGSGVAGMIIIRLLYPALTPTRAARIVVPREAPGGGALDVGPPAAGA